MENWCALYSIELEYFFVFVLNF